MKTKIIVGLLVSIAVIVIGNIILPVPRAAIEVAAEPIGLGPITNALFTSIILSIIIVVAAFFIGRNLKDVPSGVQNVVEVLIEALDGLVNSIAPKKWAPTFFPILATIFIYLLFANWFSLLTPLLGSFGIVHPTDHGGIPVENVTFITGGPESLHMEEGHGKAEESHGEAAGVKEVLIVPIFRAPSSDLNLTFALALTTMVLVQVFGVWERGLAYFGNFFRFNAFAKKGVLMGAIDFFVGILEGVSEIAKIISFSFRLFGNIFAGEVVLIVVSSLVSLLLLLVFFGLEIFVGVIQAFVFFILSLVFYSMATQHHGEEH
ncbi:MAG: ATP synthase F0 subunit A [Chloroflexi bacterium]|nr:MAG: ATP synthase F0 subunit A [Chloroflexota bacterium]